MRWAAHALHNVTPAEWRQKIALIEPEDLRNQVASIIWWDFCGEYSSNDSWTELDTYRNAWDKFSNVKDADLVEELIKLGYSPKMAKSRIVHEERKDC